MELVPQANIFLKNAFHRKDLMFCKDNRKQEKIIFHINQCLHIKSSLGKFLLPYLPPEFNRFKQMSSNYLGFSLGFCLFHSLKDRKLPKKSMNSNRWFVLKKWLRQQCRTSFQYNQNLKKVNSYKSTNWKRAYKEKSFKVGTKYEQAKHCYKIGIS